MNNLSTAPPVWVRIIFYLLIVAILLGCVMTFVLKASCLFTEIDPRSMTYTIVIFGVGLSLICGILWVGGVTSIISISSTVQKSLWITLIAAVLSITVSVYKGFFSSAYPYKVIGEVNKEDKKDPRDIVVSKSYPPIYPVPQTEKNVGIDVFKDPNGNFPVLAFSHSDYITERLDLNDRSKVELKDLELNIKNPITLRLMPTR